MNWVKILLKIRYESFRCFKFKIIDLYTILKILKSEFLLTLFWVLGTLGLFFEDGENRTFEGAEIDDTEDKQSFWREAPWGRDAENTLSLIWY